MFVMRGMRTLKKTMIANGMKGVDQAKNLSS